MRESCLHGALENLALGDSFLSSMENVPASRQCFGLFSPEPENSQCRQALLTTAEAPGTGYLSLIGKTIQII